MKISLFNLVRTIYWDDRENIELEMLQTILEKSYEVSIYNLSEQEFEDINFLEFECNVALFMIDFNADYVTIENIYSFSKKLKEKSNSETKIILIGYRAWLNRQEILDECDCFDYIIEGEVEDACKEIDSICNLLMPQKEKKGIPELSKLAWAKRDKKLLSDLKYAKIRTTRGCNGNCLFCIDKGCVGITKIRDMTDVANEIDNIISNYSIKKISFYDNSFEDPDYVDKSRIREFLGIIKKNNWKIYFDCSVRAESFKNQSDFELLKEMSECGFYKMVIGFESGYTKDLEFFNKRATVDDNIRIAKFLNDCHISYSMPPGFIMFHPFSSKESLKQNYNLLLELRKGYSMLAVCSFLKVFPKSKMHEILISNELSNVNVSYNNLVQYEYYNKEITQLAQFLFEKRYTSRTVEIGLFIDKMKEVLAMVKKDFTIWNRVSDFEEDIENIARELTELVKVFFVNALDNIENEEYIHDSYRELEEKSSKLKERTIMKKFVLYNINNEELRFIL